MGGNGEAVEGGFGCTLLLLALAADLSLAVRVDASLIVLLKTLSASDALDTFLSTTPFPLSPSGVTHLF